VSRDLRRGRPGARDPHFSRHGEVEVAPFDAEPPAPPALAPDDRFDVSSADRDVNAGDAAHRAIAALDPRDMTQDNAAFVAAFIDRRVRADVDFAGLREHARKGAHHDMIAQLAVAADDDFLDLAGGRVELEAGESSDLLTVLTNVGTKQQFHWAPPSRSQRT
jgi:hypothetical protein